MPQFEMLAGASAAAKVRHRPRAMGCCKYSYH